MTLLDLNYAAAIFLYILGLYCIVTKRNMIKLVIGFEILFHAVIYTLVLIATQAGLLGTGQVVVALSIVIDAVIVALALALIINAFKHYKTLDVTKLRRLRG